MFESLVKDVFSEKFARIETWPEYAKKHAKYTAQDLGIDLVAYDSENTKHAIQCKYRSNGSPPLRKQDIDKFVSACHAHRIDKMILAHTESALKPNVCETCRDIDTYGPKRLARLHNTRETNTNGNVWNFPPTGRGGQEYGFNQAGFEIFGGRQNRQRQTLPKEMIESVVRELLQNSLDAKMPNEACRVKFERLDIDPDAIAADDLAKHMDACKEQDDHPEFFKDAGRTLRSSRIDSIRVTDSNTTGLNKRGWRACIVVEGRSAKESDTDGGSYGLGKNAPFAMSSVGVVCYATRLPRGSAGGGGGRQMPSPLPNAAPSHM